MQYTHTDKVKACQVAIKAFRQRYTRYQPNVDGHLDMAITETVFLGSRHNRIAVGITVKWEGGLQQGKHSWRMFAEFHLEMEVLHHDGLRFLKFAGMHRSDGYCFCKSTYEGREKVYLSS